MGGRKCRKEVSAVRAGITIGLVKEHGVAIAEVARRVGVSTTAISKIMKRRKWLFKSGNVPYFPYFPREHRVYRPGL